MRDYRIDFFRGLALIAIFINHLPSNIYAYLTPKNYGLSDAAEVFVLLAGISSAYAYYPRFASGDVRGANERVIRRAFSLYVAQIAGSVALLVLFGFFAIYLADSALLEQNLIDVFLRDPIRGWIGVATFGHQFGYFNMLPMYMIFLLMLPAIMALARLSTALLLGVSFTLWVLAGTFGLNIPNYPRGGFWFFNPIAWQFLFAIGFVVGVRLREGGRVTYRPWLYRMALVYLAISAVWVLFHLWGTLPELPLPFVLYGIDKTYLTTGRLLHVLALAYVVAHSPLMPWLKGKLSGINPVVMAGRHSLAIFCVGTLLSMTGLILKPELNGGIAFDTVAVVMGLTILFLLAATLELGRTATRTAVPKAGASLGAAELAPAS